MKNYFKSLFKEQPEERFFSLKLTKAVLWSFGFMFVITFTISFCDAVALEFKPTSEGVNYVVFELFKAPVAVAGFALPILGLIGLNHRSEQTKKQIASATLQLAISERQNLFNNYFKHLEEFKKHIESMDGERLLRVSSITHLHDRLFEGVKVFGDYDICSPALDELLRNLKETVSFIENANNLSEIINFADEKEHHFSSIPSVFCIDKITTKAMIGKSSSKMVEEYTPLVITLSNGVVAYYRNLELVINYLCRILEFKGDSDWPVELRSTVLKIHPRLKQLAIQEEALSQQQPS